MLMDNIIVRALSRLFDFIVLNILWLICSLPIITIGAATSALYSVMLKVVVNEEGYIIRDYLKSFRNNFRQSTIVWVLLLILGVFLNIDLMIILRMPITLRIVLMIILLMVIILYAIEFLFVFPMISIFENTTGNMIKNALLIPISRLPYTLLVVFMTGMCLMLTFLNETSIMIGAAVWSVVGVSVLTYANSFLIRRVLEPYMK